MSVIVNPPPETCPYCGQYPSLKHDPKWLDYAVKYTCGCSRGAAFPEDRRIGRTFGRISYEWDVWARNIKNPE